MSKDDVNRIINIYNNDRPHCILESPTSDQVYCFISEQRHTALTDTSISGVILAGGTNKRFGGITKSNVVVGGKTIISRMISTIGDLFDDIIIVTNKPEEFREYTQYKIVEDQYLKAGPLGGIHSALEESSEDAIFVFAGDMPFLNKAIITNQINEFNNTEHDILIPEVDQFIEPLHAIYRKSVLNDLERFLSAGKSRAVRDFLREVNVGYLQIPKTEKTEKAFANINSPSDLDKISF
jgi:molybdopterin-guanine dinucleotide biosynthesis protein A